MVRNRMRKTGKGLSSETSMRDAVELVEKGMSLRKAAEMKDVNFTTLYRYVHKKKNKENETEIRMTPNYAVRKIFSEELESELKEYLVNCSKMCYGLDTLETRRLAYELAKHHNLKIPPSWENKKIAGIDWLYGFRKRHPDLRLRKPEACSLSRATSFHKHNVQLFFNNLHDVIQRHSSFGEGLRVFALDETGTTTVQKHKKVLASKTTRQLNKVTSAERGTLVTVCCMVSATGSALPPVFVFPRKNFKTHMLNRAPPAALGLAQPTGWMTGELFAEVIKHFIKMTSSTKDNPTLLIMDNHKSHMAPPVLNIAKENGVTILTIPPHSSHKLQPLDVAVFGPFQSYYNSAVDSWMIHHPGQTVTIYHIAELVGQAYEKAMTPSNIKSGFRKTGIFPFDRDIFTDDDFFTSEVTNRRLDETLQSPQLLTYASKGQEPPSSTPNAADLSDVLAQRKQNITRVEIPTNPFLKSPIECRDYPKAGLRKETTKRKKGRSLILTDTPVKNEIENLSRQRGEKPLKSKTRVAKLNQIKTKTARKVLFLSSESEEAFSDGYNSSKDSSDDDNLPLYTQKTPKVNDFVLVKFPGKQVKYFVGEILTDIDENNEFEISYLRRSAKIENSFYFPLEPDLAVVSNTDIELVLPCPNVAGKTKRQKNIYKFSEICLKKYSLG